MTLADLNLIFEVLNLEEEDMYTCVAISGGNAGGAGGESSPDLHGHTMPSLMRR